MVYIRIYGRCVRLRTPMDLDSFPSLDLLHFYPRLHITTLIVGTQQKRRYTTCLHRVTSEVFEEMNGHMYEAIWTSQTSKIVTALPIGVLTTVRQQMSLLLWQHCTALKVLPVVTRTASDMGYKRTG